MGCVTGKSKQQKSTIEQKYSANPNESKVENKKNVSQQQEQEPQSQQQQQQIPQTSKSVIQQKELIDQPTAHSVPAASQINSQSNKNEDGGTRVGATATIQKETEEEYPKPKEPANPRSQQQQPYKGITPSQPQQQEQTHLQSQYQQNNRISDLNQQQPQIDPQSLKGIANSISMQQMRQSKTENSSKLAQQQQQQQPSNFLKQSEQYHDIYDSVDPHVQQINLAQGNYQNNNQISQKDRVLNKHMMSILKSLNHSSSSKSCYTTPAVSLQTNSSWILVETFGVYGQNSSNITSSQNQYNFMND